MERDKNLDRSDLFNLNHENLNNLNRSIISSEIETIIIQKLQNPDESSAKLYKILKEITSVFLKLFQMTKKHGILISSILQTKYYIDSQAILRYRGELYTSLPDEHSD